MPFRMFKSFVPAPLWVAVRRAAGYVRRLQIWGRVLREVEGATAQDRHLLRQSARKALRTALHELDDWQDPVLVGAADLNVPGVGRFHIRPHCDDLYHVLPAREPALLRLIQTRLKPGDLFVDAGANIGFYSVAASRRVGSDGRVLAIEMMPDTASILRDHLRINDCLNAEVIEQALSDRPGRAIEARVETGKFGQASIAPQQAATGRAITSVVVQTTTLDQLLAAEPRPVALIKLDLEGAELDALRGAERVLDRTRSIIFEQLGKGSEVHDLLVQAGFSVTPLDGNNWLAARTA